MGARISFLLVAYLMLFGLGYLSGRADAAAAPHWETAGELAQPRAFARAVALATGEVLVVGGLDPLDPEVTNTTAELFDPATGRATVLAQRLPGRLNQTVTVSSYGDRVVVAGGTEWRGNHWSPVDRVDVYLPWSRTWLVAAPLHTERSDHVAAALPDGRVLVAGGNQGTTLLRSTEIYDPETDRWTIASPLPNARTQASAAVLLDGRVLVMGGFEKDGKVQRGTYVYDPRADRWTAGPPSLDERLNHSTVRLASGDVLVVGGEATGAGTAEVLDFRGRAFRRAGSLLEPRLVAQATALADGSVLLVGGLPAPVRNGFIPLASLERWDGSRWTSGPAAPSNRAFGQLVGTDRGVLWFSGSGDGERTYRTVERLALY